MDAPDADAPAISGQQAGSSALGPEPKRRHIDDGYTPQQRAAAVACYFEARQDAAAASLTIAQRWVSEGWPAPPPEGVSAERWSKQFLETGQTLPTTPPGVGDGAAAATDPMVLDGPGGAADAEAIRAEQQLEVHCSEQQQQQQQATDDGAGGAGTAPPLPRVPAGQMLQGPEDAHWFVEVTPSRLEAARLTELVTDAGAGAVAVFVGTTRDTFQGARVLRLEYEAYVPMALGKLKDLCLEIRRRWGVSRVAVAHRVGVVEVCEASVIIAVSSPHRKPALEAVHWAIDELKATVPIWKKEFFTDGSVWKENEESRRLTATVERAEVQAAGA